MQALNLPAQPAHLWRHFVAFTQIPRPSKAEAAVRDYVIGQAEAVGASWRLDDVGNLVVYVPGSPGREAQAPLIIQNHLDMVTVKTDAKAHDFFRDPLSLQVRDGWLMADDTTLGADNGVGCAAAIALMTDPDVVHPPLELLFTVDEETGLGGALGLDASLLTGRRMLNLDTEDWHELYVGCAGGATWELERSFALEPVPAGSVVLSLELKGLAGGHSGIQIHEQLGNGSRLLGECLGALDGACLADFSGGTAHNVIPAEARARIVLPEVAAASVEPTLSECRERWLSFLPPADAGLSLSCKPGEPVTEALSAGDTRTVLDLIALFPHGAHAYSPEQPADLVELSSNLAQVRLQAGELQVEGSYRFFNERQTVGLRASVEALARQLGMTLRSVDGYPGWQPDYDSDLLARGIALHERLFGAAPAVKAIHAGLECGILKSKKPDVDMLSFGPTIRGAHSPTERLQIDTVAPFWHYLTALVAELC